MKLAGEPLRGKGSFKILCSRFGEASAFDKELVLDAAHSHLTKHIALFPVANQSEPMLACAAGSKVSALASTLITDRDFVDIVHHA